MNNKPKLTMIELFNGISAQKRGIDNTELYDLEVIATSDIDKDVIIQCAAIHCGMTNEMVENFKGYPTKECMAQSLTDRKIGLDFKTGKVYDWFKLAKKKKGMDLEKYWLAAELTNNLGDISSISKLPYSDILTYSFPCTDISVAGKQEGLAKGSGTRSGLLWEVERLLEVANENNELPKYLLMENVDALVNKKNKPDFDLWLSKLEELNYNSYWKIINAKECGVPQNRRRCFCISIRKDIDTGKFTFPIPFDNGLRLKDILEKNVDEKYYINTERASNLIQQLVDKGQLKGQRVCCDMSDNNPNTREIANCIVQRYDKGISAMRQEGTAVAEPQTDLQPILVKNMGTEYVKDLDESVTLKARDWKGWDNYGSTAVVESEKLDTSKRLGGLWDGETRHQAGSVWDTNGMSPTLDTAQGGGRMPHIAESKQQREQLIVNIGNSSRYRINNFGEVFDNQNGTHKLEEIDGYVELEVGGELRKVFVESLMNKYFPKFLSEYQESKKPEVIGIKQATKKGYIECELPGVADLSFPNSKTRRRRVESNGQIVPTLTAAEGGIRYIESIYRIRKLTPRETSVLMGFTTEDCDKCSAIGISNSALYKAHGNSIAVPCIELLFEHLYKAQYDESYICTDEKMQNFQKPEVG